MTKMTAVQFVESRFVYGGLGTLELKPENFERFDLEKPYSAGEGDGLDDAISDAEVRLAESAIEQGIEWITNISYVPKGDDKLSGFIRGRGWIPKNVDSGKRV